MNHEDATEQLSKSIWYSPATDYILQATESYGGARPCITHKRHSRWITIPNDH